MLEIPDPYSTFLFGMRSPKTREKCVGRLRIFFDLIEIPKGSMKFRCQFFYERISSETGREWLLTNIIKFLQFQKERFERKEITAGTVKNYYQAVKLFCEMNGISIPVPWKKIQRGLPRTRKFAEDRAPTLEEIRKIMEYPDRRIKAIICTMVSSGIRVGAWDYLKFKDIIPLERQGKIIAAKLIVYSGEDDEYFSFVSREAYLELEKYRQHRIQSGEQVTKESWVMRNTWDTKKGYKRGLISAPKKLQPEGVKRLVEDALWTQGIRSKLDPNKKRHEFQTDHGFRKFFMTQCISSKVHPLYAQILMGHSTGIMDSYNKPTEEQLLDEYLKAADALTIDSEYVLRKRFEKITEEKKNNDYIVRGKLQEKDEEIRSLKDDMNSMRDDVKDIYEVLRIAKRTNGRLGKDRTMLDEKGRISFCQAYENGRTISVKIPIDPVEITDARCKMGGYCTVQLCVKANAK